LVFSNLSNEQKLTQFPEEFQVEVKNLYRDQLDLDSINSRIEKTVYNLHLLTGKSYDDLKTNLELAFGKQLSKSYFSKLLTAGRVLSNNPECANIKDREKLAIIGQIDDPEVISMIARENNLASLSRASTKKLVDSVLIKDPTKNVRSLDSKQESSSSKKSDKSGEWHLIRGQINEKLNNLSENQLYLVDQFLNDLPVKKSEIESAA